jgi:hypothetical protein
MTEREVGLLLVGPEPWLCRALASLGVMTLSLIG